ncbi:DUF932 domain-containing protein [Lachnospiraceae bacterium ZAX-1]
MAANVESMFYVRETPWHGLGTRVEETLTSKDALHAAGLNWRVLQKPVMTGDYRPIPGYKVNVRDSDNSVLGVVGDRYSIVQNDEAFAFTDVLLGEGVKYETAGSLQGGRRVWILAKLPEKYIIGGESIEPYLVFSNSHDGSASMKVCMTPIRVVCQNTLNLALLQAKRTWSAKHTGNVQFRLHEAQETLGLAHLYMKNLGAEFNSLNKIKLSDAKVMDFIKGLLPLPDNATATQRKNAHQVREDMKMRYFDAPDLKDVGKNGFRFICAVSDFATHAKPLRETSGYQENLFMKTTEGHPLTDKALIMLNAA